MLHGLYQCYSLLDQVVNPLVKMPESLVLSLPAMKSNIDLLQHHRQLEKRENFVVVDQRKIAAGQLRITPDQLIARKPAWSRGERSFGAARIARLGPITKNQAQIHQRITHSGHRSE